MSRALPECVVCHEQAAFSERFPVTDSDSPAETLWVHERCANRLAAYLLLQTLPTRNPDRPERNAAEVPPAARRAGLTQRELVVLHYMANGYTNQQIADALGVKHKTARNIVSSILGKLDAVNRAEAVAIATREGLLD